MFRRMISGAIAAVRVQPLGVPGCNGKEHPLALRREFGFDTPNRESRRADSNRLPLLQLRVRFGEFAGVHGGS